MYALAEDPSGMKTSLDAPCDPKALEKELDSCGILASGTWEGRYANRDNSEWQQKQKLSYYSQG